MLKLIAANNILQNKLNTLFTSASYNDVKVFSVFKNNDLEELNPFQYVMLDMQEASITEVNAGSYVSDLNVVLSTQVLNENELTPVETHEAVSETIGNYFFELLNSKVSSISTGSVGFHWLQFKGLKEFISDGEYVTEYNFNLHYGN